MVLTRLLGHAAIACVLATGGACKQSIFDSNVDDFDAGGENPPGPDGGTPSACDDPCLGDGFAEFAETQGGTNNRWTYLQEARDPIGLGYADMVLGQAEGRDGWIGQAGPSSAFPAIVTCEGGGTGCEGVEDTLLFVPTPNTTGERDPVLSFRVPADGTYRFYGSIVSPESAETGIQHRLLVSRNGRNDALLHELFATSHTLAPFDVTLEALEGDQLRFSILGNTGTPIPVAADVFVTDLLLGAGECQIASTFVSDFGNECSGGAMWVEDNSDVPPVVTGDVEPPAGVVGRARHFPEGAALRYSAGTMDYGGDFTIQFWFIHEPDGSFGQAVYSDWSCAATGGVAVFFDDPNLVIGGYWNDTSQDFCAAGAPPAPIYINTSIPSYDEWHFFRLTRSTEDESLRVCIDGQLVGQDTVPADVDMTSNEAPRLGRNVDYEPAYYVGSLADVRVLGRALPCPTLP
jgi:hypothetical protein